MVENSFERWENFPLNELPEDFPQLKSTEIVSSSFYFFSIFFTPFPSSRFSQDEINWDCLWSKVLKNSDSTEISNRLKLKRLCQQLWSKPILTLQFWSHWELSSKLEKAQYLLWLREQKHSLRRFVINLSPRFLDKKKDKEACQYLEEILLFCFHEEVALKIQSPQPFWQARIPRPKEKLYPLGQSALSILQNEQKEHEHLKGGFFNNLNKKSQFILKQMESDQLFCYKQK
jgi:hypothetical protein